MYLIKNMYNVSLIVTLFSHCWYINFNIASSYPPTPPPPTHTGPQPCSVKGCITISYYQSSSIQSWYWYTCIIIIMFIVMNYSLSDILHSLINYFYWSRIGRYRKENKLNMMSFTSILLWYCPSQTLALEQAIYIAKWHPSISQVLRPE